MVRRSPWEELSLQLGAFVTTPGKGYQASKDQLLDRLARIKGQVGGIERMVGEDRYWARITSPSRTAAIGGAALTASHHSFEPAATGAVTTNTGTALPTMPRT